MVQVIRSILWDLRGCLNQKFFEKNATFSVKKCICLIISQIVECDKPQETIYKGQKFILTNNVEVIRSYFKTKEVVENTNF